MDEQLRGGIWILLWSFLGPIVEGGRTDRDDKTRLRIRDAGVARTGEVMRRGAIVAWMWVALCLMGAGITKGQASVAAATRPVGDVTFLRACDWLIDDAIAQGKCP